MSAQQRWRSNPAFSVRRDTEASFVPTRRPLPACGKGRGQSRLLLCRCCPHGPWQHHRRDGTTPTGAPAWLVWPPVPGPTRTLSKRHLVTRYGEGIVGRLFERSSVFACARRFEHRRPRRVGSALRCRCCYWTRGPRRCRPPSRARTEMRATSPYRLQRSTRAMPTCAPAPLAPMNELFFAKPCRLTRRAGALYQ
jgi:hypothetical protein